MSLDLQEPDELPLTSIDALIGFFRQAERDASQLKVGIEHEKLVYTAASGRSAPYETDSGIRALLNDLEPQGYSAFRDQPNGPTIALIQQGLTVSLEPGGQLELSGRPFLRAMQAHRENLEHIAQVRRAADLRGLIMVGLGYRPFERTDEISWMPKRRYEVMRRTLPERGALALNMMLMTATVQVSLDWCSEEDCARKMTCAARAAPLMVALYANSPLVAGKPSGLMSFRNRVWLDVDPTRCGYLPWMIDGRFTYRAYVDWALDAPLLFLRRAGQYVTPRMTFRELLAKGFEGKPARHGDWVDHLSTLFPEVRLKKVLEIRGADSCDAARTGALAALWRGLLYDRTALDETLSLLPALGIDEHRELHRLAFTEGLAGCWRDRKLASLAGDLVQIANRGLQRLDPADAPLLEPLADLARAGASPAARVLRAWESNPDPQGLLREFAL